jgi:sec-independent protein translocase protein TatC
MKDREKKMPWVGHLEELRNRLLKCLASVGLCFAVAFFFSDHLFSWLKQPLRAELVFLSPAEAFWAHLKVSLFGGFLLSLPVLFYQVWSFVVPGLFRHERKYGLIFILFSALFFLLGLTFCSLVVLPFALHFLITFGSNAGIKPTISVGLYVDFVLKLLLAFGLIFQLPLVITLLSRLGLLTSEFLSRHRRYAVLLAFIAAAILTPTPDVFNQTLMAGPIILLYELGILSARLFAKRVPSSGVTEEELHEGI